MIEQLEDPTARSNAITRIVSDAVVRSPDEALALADRLAKSEDEQRNAIQNIMFRGANYDPEAAAVYTVENLDDTVFTNGMTNIMSRWAQYDPEAAADFLQELPEAPRNDPAIASYARTVGRSDPATGLAWALSISDDNQRTNTVRGIARQWQNQDENAPRDFFRENGFEEATIDSILGPPKD